MLPRSLERNPPATEATKAARRIRLSHRKGAAAIRESISANRAAEKARFTRAFVRSSRVSLILMTPYRLMCWFSSILRRIWRMSGLSILS